MKVCMLAYTYYERDNRVKRYAETLCRRGEQVDVIALRSPGQSHQEKINGIDVFRIQTRQRNEHGSLAYLVKLLCFFINSSIFLIKKHIKDHYDLIHVHSVPDFEVFATWLPKLTGAKVILDIHDIVPEFYAAKFHKSQNSIIFKILVLMEKICTAFSDHVVIANHIWYDKLICRSVEGNKCTVILNYPDTTLMRERPRKRKNDKFILAYPGTLNWHQGLDIAIKAFALIRDEIADVEFHIYGDGKNKETLMNLTKELALEDIVFFKGVLPIEQIVSEMAEVDLGIVPKRKNSFGNEAFSTKILEFMALGIPVIVADTKIDRFYFDNSIVRFFRSENVQDLAQAILSMKGSKSLRKRFATEAGKFITRNNWEIKKEEYLQLVDNLVEVRKIAV